MPAPPVRRQPGVVRGRGRPAPRGAVWRAACDASPAATAVGRSGLRSARCAGMHRGCGPGFLRSLACGGWLVRAARIGGRRRRVQVHPVVGCGPHPHRDEAEVGQDAIPGQARVQRFEQGWISAPARSSRKCDTAPPALPARGRAHRRSRAAHATGRWARAAGVRHRTPAPPPDAVAIAHQLRGQAVPRFAAGCAAGDQPVFVQVEVIDQAQLARLQGSPGGTGRARRAARADRHQAGVQHGVGRPTATRRRVRATGGTRTTMRPAHRGRDGHASSVSWLYSSSVSISTTRSHRPSSVSAVGAWFSRIRRTWRDAAPSAGWIGGAILCRPLASPARWRCGHGSGRA